jgi:cation diffusion facilitator CzcD-associated flavoprotein CzcO
MDQMSDTDPGHVTTEVLIVGAGFAGLGLAIKLKRQGFNNFLVIDRGNDVGGTWRDNTYPGVACDVPSHVYSFSFRPNPYWSAVRAPGAEIQEYLRTSAREERILPHLRLNEPMELASWNEETDHWIVETPGATYDAHFVVAACGHLADVNLPKIDGVDTFTGHLFHSARWNHDVPLEGKRIALVGSGASGIQLLPELARVASQVVVFQRTPTWIMPSPNPTFSKAQQQLFARYPEAIRELRSETFWGAEANFAARRGLPKALEAARHMMISHLERSVPDPELRAKLTPDYEVGCKRTLGSDLYYPALQQEHVTLEASALARIDADRAISAEGNAYDIDIIVFATGFEAAQPEFPMHIRGRGGQVLADWWHDGMTAYASNTTHGFPNLFIMNGPNTSSGHNSAIYILEAQMDYILGALDFAHEAGATVLEVTAEAEQAYIDHVRRHSVGTVWVDGGCRNWYTDPRTGALTVTWPDFMHEFRERNARFDPAVYTVHAEPAIA